MNTAIAPNVQPHRYDSEEWPALVPDIPDGDREAIDAHSLDPTQGSKIGSDPYDDPMQGRRIGSDPYDDPTQGRKVGADPYDPTQARKVRADPYDDPDPGSDDRVSSLRRPDQRPVAPDAFTRGGEPHRHRLPAG